MRRRSEGENRSESSSKNGSRGVPCFSHRPLLPHRLHGPSQDGLEDDRLLLEAVRHSGLQAKQGQVPEDGGDVPFAFANHMPKEEQDLLDYPKEDEENKQKSAEENEGMDEESVM